MATLELLQKVAEGSAAEAFLARTETETVLVEVSRPGLSDDIELYGRFLDEARERQKLVHPHLLQLKEAGCRQDGRLFAVSESLSGLHLGSLGIIAAEQALEFLVPLCEALSYLHARGVMHGHLKPSHVFLSGSPEQPVPKLLDMGLLLFRSTKSVKTSSKLVLVPPEYLSPDRILGQRATPRSDVYGLGVLAYEMLMGRPPFKGADAEETRRLQMTAPVPRLHDSAVWLQPWLNRCLQKDIESRFASMDQARDALLEANRSRLTFTPQVMRDGLGTVSMRPVDEPPVVRGRLEAEAQQLGPYELKELLGEGGMGQVWLAEHSKLQRKVAIKLLKPELVRVEAQVQRFFDEARAVNKVNHPHIVEITDFVEEREMGRVWCVMEYLKGSTLKVVGRDETMSIARSVKIVRQVCDALDAAHRVGVVHRDIKPDNIFLVEGKGDGDFVKVLDFGVAKLKEEHGASGHTDAGEIVGTPAYMSPEQALGQEVDPRSDLYSLGTLLYVLLAGRFPFDGVTAGQLVANIVSKEPLPLPKMSRSNEAITEELEGVLMRCLEKDPAARYATMRALSEALVPFETTQTFATVDDGDLIHIEDTGETAVVKEAEREPIELELDEPSPRRGRAVFFGVAALALASVAVAGRIVWPEAVLGGGEGAPAGVAAVRFVQVEAGPVAVVPDAGGVRASAVREVAAGVVKKGVSVGAPVSPKRLVKKKGRSR
ncbi:MAG: serine/threonine protein kinase [Myxococcaceae bacterium]|nr:serine/threonine protein kinase [Myxococcaceae bacterium]